MRQLLDADVLIGALDRNDIHHDKARDLLTAWRGNGDAIMISVVNLSEVLIAPAADPARLARARAAITALGVETHLPTETIAIDAARLRHGHPISLSDAYCLATARRTGSRLATFDRKVLRAASSEDIETI